MKKLAALVLAILMFCSVYGVMASEDPYFHTIREALDISEGYAAINETDDYVILILEKDGKTLRVVTMMDESAKELYQTAMAEEDSSAFEMVDAYAWNLPVSYTEEITAMPLEQAELDALAGRAIRDIMREWQCRGFVTSSSGNDKTVISLDYGMYKYSFEVEDQGDMELAKVIKGEVSGFSRAAFDLSCHADGTF
ncbi:hypothetical protein [Aristaeella hokkaidonensis]|uniref:Uncharacterized protein n=1 Tax=Aristaeella hokkaidonensis TaxID=3046382 RepID=A0AC61MZ14_9FIRM|nr:hypothetical protein [Aristaeella hokkaidonensis]QUC67243.1 hypothetical protein JYE49_00555 [Aristaeella hokkaidonensis]SNT93433.1 hypothetical protein SAMN06297421_102215 [Aristaeella hokkaidonensis]